MIRNTLFRLILFLLISLPAAGLSFDLYEAEDLALASSMEIRQAREQLGLAALNRKLEIRSFLPTLDITYSDSYYRVLYGEDSEALSLALDLSQPVFDGGRTAAGRRLSSVQLELQSAALEKTIEDLRDRVWQIFYQLLLYREKLKLQRELHAISTEQLGITRRKMELGAITEIDYLDALMNLRNQEIEILETESEKESLEKDFLFLLGLDIQFMEGEELVLRGEINREYPGLPLFRSNLELYKDKALSCNLDLRNQEAAILQARTQCRLIRRSAIPAIDLEISISFSGEHLPLQDFGYSAGITLDFPSDPFPFSGSAGSSVPGEYTDTRSISGETSILPDLGFIGDRRTAELSLKQETSSLKEMRKQICHAISLLFETLEQKRLRLALLRENQTLQEKKLGILETRNKLGEVPELDLLEARSEYYEGEISLGESVLDLLVSERNLEQLLGLETGALAFFCNEKNDE